MKDTNCTPRAVPCECGSHDAHWHGPEDGAREYCCDACWTSPLRLTAATIAARAARNAVADLPFALTPPIAKQGSVQGELF